MEGSGLSFSKVKVENPKQLNFIFGQSHFIKTVEDLYETLIQCSSSISFGLAFCEASGDRLIRAEGNDEDLKKLAITNAERIAAGHTFIVFLDKAFPINVLRDIKLIPEVVRIFCATANDVEVIIAESELGRGVMGVIDGQTPLGVENAEQVEERQKFLRTIGYKRG
eukprot:CAMPEP_0174258134 /NCGR_PEP_ID=MMETSP0439-20130205/7190_1 /TAXON_ID=0 /ORGANISM="Stereomyxa ramosa, Strain Chinc5" /LENGTH=166 /DNA_ID=CAMNT_0015341525 /DNA_START=6 /DNA_END=506 /DNA_ORIENTATION=-